MLVCNRDTHSLAARHLHRQGLVVGEEGEGWGLGRACTSTVPTVGGYSAGYRATSDLTTANGQWSNLRLHIRLQSLC